MLKVINVSLKIAQQNNNSFPFASEQCQQLISMLNSHVFSFGSNDSMHSTNSAINSNALSGISCDLFQDSMCLNMQHSVFAVNPANKTAFDSET